ncbi:uncharacterized protein [Gossypium hirsutum]|uniref:Uncharacterized protein n=1 Tax=Gossypium hirsutum TaxID=3635 RepID=A0A1U8IDJ2_GOSHI|nr:uncharacterized protein LOC107895516 [Gossypium hirsutum]
MGESFEGEVKRFWDWARGDIYVNLERVRKGLCDWVKMVRRKMDWIKRDLTNKLDEVLEKEKDDDTLEELINTKIQFNLEIDKDEMFWEQRARVNWLWLGDKNKTFSHNYASQQRMMNRTKGFSMRMGE